MKPKNKNDYIYKLEWKFAITVFEISTNMVKVVCNYGKQQNNAALYVVNRTH